LWAETDSRSSKALFSTREEPKEKIDIPQGRKNDFRREIVNYIGTLAVAHPGQAHRLAHDLNGGDVRGNSPR
jgi:hypothetical protein